MKFFNFLITAIQTVLVAAYIMFYNVQYYWTLKSTVMNIINMLVR
jgi:hypothetical protein